MARLNSKLDAIGYQWIIDPSGHRWKVVGFNPVLAYLEDVDGRQINVGRSILQKGFASGAWQEAEFEEIQRAVPPLKDMHHA